MFFKNQQGEQFFLDLKKLASKKKAFLKEISNFNREEIIQSMFINKLKGRVILEELALFNEPVGSTKYNESYHEALAYLENSVTAYRVYIDKSKMSNIGRELWDECVIQFEEQLESINFSSISLAPSGFFLGTSRADEEITIEYKNKLEFLSYLLNTGKIERIKE